MSSVILPGIRGGGGARVRARLAIGGSSASIVRVIVYGNGSLPAMHTINGSAQVMVSGLETCKALNGNLNWSLASFAVYTSPRGRRAIVADTTVTGWTCAAQ